MKRLLSSALFLTACSGIAVIDAPSGGTGGTGGTGATGGAGGAGATGGIGGIGGTGATGGGGIGGSFCETIVGEVDCLAAFPSCVPIYDDHCCPSCTPGPCADCTDWRFEACTSAATACGTTGPGCGVTPGWACAGGVADCPDGQPCNQQPGCTEQTCALNEPCPGTILCTPVQAGICETQCDSVPPPCPDGTVAESNGFCYTGFCVTAELCL